MRRWALWLGIASVLAAPVRANADDVATLDWQALVATGERLLGALSKSHDDVLVLLSAEIEIVDLTFKSKDCRHAFGKPKKVNGALRARLAKCLLDLEHGPQSGQQGWVAGSLGTERAALYGPGVTWFILGIESTPGGTTSISRIEQNQVVRGGPPYDEPDDEPPRVPWRELERLRRSGNPKVLSDRAIARKFGLTRRRVLGVWDVCVSDTGEVGPDRVRMVESTLSDDFDATIESAIAAWKFKPFRLDGLAIEVCSSFPVIYAPKQP